MLLLTVCAVICGAEGWDEIEDFGHAKLDFCANTVILRLACPAMAPWAGRGPGERRATAKRVCRMDEGLP
ncbi:transposase family protein [Halomonas sp. NCCP-2165]